MHFTRPETQLAVVTRKQDRVGEPFVKHNNEMKSFLYGLQFRIGAKVAIVMVVPKGQFSLHSTRVTLHQ